MAWKLTHKSGLILLLVLVTFLKEIIFSMIVPIWHTPDEQAHFAQVAYYSEFGSMPLSGKDLSKEIYTSEDFLGTLRDDRGNNKFTFHPEYKIEYTNSLNGKYEDQIKNIPVSGRKELVKQEAANYPPLYYQLSSLLYKLFYYSDLITRVYAVRFLSILISLGLVYFAYLIGKELFPENEVAQLTLPVMVSFQPMVSFVSAGVTSDNLLNFLFTVFIYLMILIVKKGVDLKKILLTGLVIFLMYLTKPQFIYALPMLLLAVIFSFKRWRSVLISLGLLAAASIAYFISRNFLLGLEKQVTYLYSFDPGYAVGFTVNLTPLQYIRNLLFHTYAEVIPWYWGVFDWLSVTLPHIANRVINWLMVLAGIGFIVRLVKVRSRKDLPTVFIFGVII